MKLSQLIFKNEAESYTASGEEIIERITNDPRDIDGSTLLYLPDLSKLELLPEYRKPAAILCPATESPNKQIPTVTAKDHRQLIAFASARLTGYKNGGMRVVGITGTNGKTGTATFLKAALEADGRRIGMIGTGIIESRGRRLSDRFYSMTTPDPWILFPALAKMESDGCEAVIMEVSSHALALNKVAPINFDYAIFTNLSPEHLDFHKDMDEYFAAKERLFEKCKIAIVNRDDAYGRRLLNKRKAKSISAGVLWDGDVRATMIENKGFDGLEYFCRGRDHTMTVRIKTPGLHNVYNSLLALSAATDMGVAPRIARTGVGELDGVGGRFEIIKDEITVIIDYAHTAKALETLLQEIRSLGSGGSLHTVFGCGGQRDKQKRPEMARVAERYSDRVTVTSDNPRGEAPEAIINDILCGFSSLEPRVIQNRTEAIKDAIINAQMGDLIALVGKGAERYNIDSNGYSDFDEREIVFHALRERQKNED